MRTWLRALRPTLCGLCGGTIAGPKKDRPGAPMLEIRTGLPARGFVRCQACAKARYGAEAPDPFPEKPDVPVPTLPADLIRRPDFVTADHAARAAKHFIDRKMRQTGGED